MDLNQITIPSADLSKSIPFYKTLGLTLIVESLPNYARFKCPNGTSTLSLHQCKELPTGDGIWIYFECENLYEYVESLKQKGISFDLEPTAQSWLWLEAKLKDPDGNQIVLFYAGENRVNPPWRLESSK